MGFSSGKKADGVRKAGVAFSAARRVGNCRANAEATAAIYKNKKTILLKLAS
jgi:hypothetical protein